MKPEQSKQSHIAAEGKYVIMYSGKFAPKDLINVERNLYKVTKQRGAVGCYVESVRRDDPTVKSREGIRLGETVMGIYDNQKDGEAVLDLLRDFNQELSSRIEALKQSILQVKHSDLHNQSS